MKNQDTIQDTALRGEEYKPTSLYFIGSGNPIGNDPSQNAQHTLTQNLLYLCRNKERSALELAEETGIPIYYIEEELKRQCEGSGGEYSLLRKTEWGKYIADILIADKEEYETANQIYGKYAPAFCELLAAAITAKQEEMQSFWRRNMQGGMDRNLLLWALLPEVIGNFIGQTGRELKSYFGDVKPVDRPFTTVAVRGLSEPGFIYGGASISAHGVCGYSDIMVRNLYGRRLRAHFLCDHDLIKDPLLQIVIRSVEGLSVHTLFAEERETALQAVEQGYLREKDGILEPAILILWDGISVYIEFLSLLDSLEEETGELAKALAGELGKFMRKVIPIHLRKEYPYYNSCIASHAFFDSVVEECIRRGILNAPNSPLGPEGVLMVLCV